MIVMNFQKPRLYLRRDPDSGWCLTLWKGRIFFNVVRGKL